ncbi:phospholipid/cholesterol/gamma-HCH transport system substrate-binding protein [Prauserella shujinwangii]|uniref:Phospholipid/cholesterol/gamma-HCH transport system substrate-binding protein n=1 Tax=Prauserella shujinwangii TaxID=1453103 RepID=A0A2T0LL22_9PSEU|nr:MCE family protein [Prauserella shujinwangii]PRX43660.1 phospholipid/cholesterol/gamma-HCH transport system substrate-binding protein [Prauserella shujinwangii]
MTGDRGRLRYHAFGVVFLLLLAGLGWFAVAVYQKSFTRTVDVTLHAGRAGTQLTENADVKVNGVLVGTVRDIRLGEPGRGIEVGLALDPAFAGQLPANVTARLLPKTLFGQRYVSLVLPEEPAPVPLRAGAEIRQDRDPGSVELEQALNDLLPVLRTVQPQKLASTLGAVAQALEGRGELLGRTLETLGGYLARLNPAVPELREAITRFADAVDGYQAAAPDLVSAFADLRATGVTLARHDDDLGALLRTVTGAAHELERFTGTNREEIIGLAAASEPTLRLLAEYSPVFPCLAEAAARLKPQVERVLGAGTDEPGLHVDLTLKPAERPRRTAPSPPPGPWCPAAGGPAPAAYSTAEHRLLTELIAAGQGSRPAEVPGWGALLVGPLLRGTEVTLR